MRVLVVLVLSLACVGTVEATKVFDDESGDGLWSTPANWDADGVPVVADAQINIDAGLTATLDYAAPDIDTLFIARVNGAGANGFGDGTLNLVGNASLFLTQDSDWSYIGQGTDKATLNVSDNASITFGGTGHLLLYWGNTECADSGGQPGAEINISDNATIVVEQSIWLWQGKSRTTITGGSLTSMSEMGLQFSTCENADNVIDVCGGELILGGDTPLDVADWVSEGKLIACGGSGTVNSSFDGGTGLTHVTGASLFASFPSPADGESDVAFDVQLQWHPAGQLASPVYDVYFGTDQNNLVLESAGQGGTTHTPLGSPIDSETTYYWRIDTRESTGGGTNTGEVWSFTTETPVAKAQLVSPTPSGALDVDNDATLVLEWIADPGADSHNVWFGECAGGLVLVSQEQVATTYNPFLDPGVDTNWATEYCWRVDAVKDGEIANTGDDWSFTTHVLVCDNPQLDISGPNGEPDCLVNFWDFAAVDWLACGADRPAACP